MTLRTQIRTGNETGAVNRKLLEQRMRDVALDLGDLSAGTAISVALEKYTEETIGGAPVEPATALLAALAAGARHIRIAEAHTWNIPCTVTTPDVTLEFLGPLQTKAFSGDVFPSWSGARPFIKNPRWTANGALYTGNIFSFTNGTRGAIFTPWCNDLPDSNGYFAEEAAVGALAAMDVFGGFLNTATSGISKAHFKLYGNDTVGPAGGVGSVGFLGPYFRVDLGASREARIIGGHAEWPVTYPATSGNGGTHAAHLIGNRFTSQRDDNTMEVDGDSHVINGNISAAAVSFIGSNFSMAGNNFPNTSVLNGTAMSVGPANFKTGFTVGASFTGSISQGQQQTTIATNAAATVTAGTDGPYIRHTGTLTADRAITLANGWKGAFFEIVRTGSGAFNLNVGTGPLKAMATGTWARFEHDGTAWAVVRSGSIG